MGRATFGGSADYSALFSSLYGNLGAAEGGTGNSTAAQAANLRYQFESKQLTAQQYAEALRALAATGDQTSTNHFNLLTTAENTLQSADAEAKRTADNAQAAADQSASDQWSNGLMSDQDWLAYVSNRAAIATDVQDKAQWAGYLLKYQSQIGDNTAEGAFKAGGSINDLILYYQNKLQSTDKSTQDYRDAQVRLNDLQDQRSSTSVQDGANAISDKINKGAATYQDLIQFYKQQLPGLRPGSDLAKQLRGEITKVQTTIDTNAKAGALEKMQYDYNRGAITGATFAKGVRAAATEFQKTDPQKYYQMLESAVALDKNPGFIGAAGRASSAAAAKNKALAATVDQLQGQRDNLLALVNQADGGQKTGYDAVSGKTVTFTPKLVDQYDAQILDTYKALSAAHEAKGDHSAAQADMASMSKYITQGAGGSTVGIIGHNTAKTADTYTNLVLSTVKELQANAASADPQPSVVADVASKWAKFAKSLEFTATKTSVVAGPHQVPPETVTTGGAAKTQLQSVDVGYLARVQAITGALQVQANAGSTPEQQQVASAALATAFGADPAFPDASAGSKAFQNISKNLVDPAYQISASARGLIDGTVTRVVDSSGKLGYFPVAPQSPTDVADGVPPQPILGSGVLNTSKQQKLIQIVIDINGRPTTVSAVASLASSNQRVWVYADKDSKALGIKKGDILTNDQVDALDKQFPGWRKNGTATLAPAMSYYSVQTPTWVDASGVSHASETWVQDTGTNQWYKDKLPIRGVQYRPDGTVQVTKGAEGPQLLMDFSSFADASGVPAPYVGENPKKVGDLIGAPNGLHVAGLAGRDLNGYVTDAPTSNPAFAYYDPMMPRMGNQDNWWQDEQRAQRATDAKSLAAARSTAPEPTKPSLGVAGKAVGGGPGGESTGINVGSIIDGLAGFARSLGVNLGSGSAPGREAAVRPSGTVDVPSRSLDIAPHQTFSGPVVGPTVGFTPPTKKTTISAPTVTAAKITAPKITVPHQVAPEPAALAATKALPMIGTPGLTRLGPTSGYAGKIVPV